MVTGLYLGIDIGSSAVKAARFDRAGRQHDVVRVACPSTGEFDPETWWGAVQSVLLTMTNVRAVGICGRGGTNVFLDAAGRVIAPSWSDRRAEFEQSDLRKEHPQLSGAALRLLAKARWWETNRGTVATALTAKDYVVYRLTGALVGDPASGGATAEGLDPLVQASPPWTLAGRVTPGAAGITGLPPGVPVAVGWHDGAAAAFGAGASEASTAAITLGTNAVYRVVTSEVPEGFPRYWDLTPGLTVSGGDIAAAGTAIAWARGLWPGAELGGSTPGADGTSFVPQLAGRIAPDVNREARGGFAGLDGSETPSDMLRAVAEGIAFSLRQVRDYLREGSLAVARSVATGGGAHDPGMAQIVADVLGAAIAVAQAEEGCRGAALLGAVAAGEMDLETARSLLPLYETFEPDEATFAAYDAGYERFLRAQRALDHV